MKKGNVIVYMLLYTFVSNLIISSYFVLGVKIFCIGICAIFEKSLRKLIILLLTDILL